MASKKSFKKIILKNGLHAILAQQPSSLATTVLVLVRAGSEYETKDISGISHFLEHLCFKGTTTRPRPGTIATELDSLGAQYNAFTDHEYTGYWAKARNRNTSQILDLIGDLYLNPIFDVQEIEKERGVIIEEINMYEDTPMRRVQDFFKELLYGDQPAGWDIGGRKEVIRRLSRDQFVQYRSRYYVAGSTVVVVAGNFDEKKTTRHIQKTFGSLKKERILAKPVTRERQTKPATLVRFKQSDQSHLVLGVRAFPVFDKRKHALQILATILGGGMSSRLFHRIREELGAAYYVHAGAEFLLDHGLLSVAVGADHQKVNIVIKAILQEFISLRDILVGDAELAKAKEHFIGGVVLGLETSNELAGFYGGQEIMTGSLHAPQELIDAIKKITARDVRAVARFVFKSKKLNLAVLGPYKNAQSFKKVLTL